jgi:16S rRNA (adenine1518-N6/adenine1519-N6)-dimethyltransferase
MKIRSNPYLILAKIKILDWKSSITRKLKRASLSIGQSQTEVLNVVDRDGKVVGQAGRGHCHQRGIPHQTVHVLIFDTIDQQNLLVQKRSMSKDLSPGLLTQSAGGHVTAPSEPVKAAIEESQEELRISIHPGKITTFWHHSDGGKNVEHITLFGAIHQGPFKTNPAEVEWVAFFPTSGIRALATKKPELFCPGFLKDLDKIRD